MGDSMTKAKLLDILKARRAEFDAALALVPESRMTQPGAAGYWSVKDVVAHLTYYERWMADRLHEALRGEVYTPGPLDFIHWDERNAVIYEQNKDRALDDVRAESIGVFRRLIEGVESHAESFLIEPQQFEGAPAPILIWDMLRSEVYDHYRQHIPSIEAWAAGEQA
jgi:hypothetical protein